MTAQQCQTAENLFHSALDLPPGDRANWLAEACPNDPGLLNAVLRMIEADADAAPAPGDEIRLAVRSAVKQWMAK